MKKISFIALILSIVLSLAIFTGCNTVAVVEPPESETAGTAAPSITPTLPAETDGGHLGGSYGDGNGTSQDVELPVIKDIRDETFDESALAESVTVPTFNGEEYAVNALDMGDGSYMHIARNADTQEFSDYLTSLVDAGFTYYADNKIGDNFYVTFATKSQILTAMYLRYSREVRVVVDDRSKFSLCGLEEENVYEDLGKNSLTVIAIEETGWPGGMGYIMELTDGSFLIIDGGYYNGSNMAKSSAEWVYKSLLQLADDPENITVAAWLITHPHGDHHGAFTAMAQKAEYQQGITIEKLIYNNPNDVYLASTSATVAAELIESSIDVWGVEELIKAHPGQEIYVRDALVTIYGSADIVVPQNFDITNVNNLTVVSMVDYMGKRALYLGDSQEVENPILARLYGKELKADILQLAHHGYNNTDAGEVYSYADPSIVFWPVSINHYSEYDGRVRDLALNQRFFAAGITNHVAGMLNMTITDFTTWEPEERWNPKEAQ